MNLLHINALSMHLMDVYNEHLTPALHMLTCFTIFVYPTVVIINFCRVWLSQSTFTPQWLLAMSYGRTGPEVSGSEMQCRIRARGQQGGTHMCC